MNYVPDFLWELIFTFFTVISSAGSVACIKLLFSKMLHSDITINIWVLGISKDFELFLL